jgi:hypothetical protein
MVPTFAETIPPAGAAAAEIREACLPRIDGDHVTKAAVDRGILQVYQDDGGQGSERPTIAQ